MPKLIENLRGRLLDETQRVLLANGYDAVTIRSIAKACGTASGTVYNYFPSKENMVASAILDDWLGHMDRARQDIAASTSTEDAFRAIYACLGDFYRRYQLVFSQSNLLLVGPVHEERHEMLCNQIAELVVGLCMRFSRDLPPTASKVMAESLLAAVTHGWPFDELLVILERIIA